GAPLLTRLRAPAAVDRARGAPRGKTPASAVYIDPPRHWRELPLLDPLPALPEGIPALASLVQAPPALGRALSQIGLTDDDTDAVRIREKLGPGQILVSRAGAVWRWDGYTIRARPPPPPPLSLQQPN